MNHYKSQVPSQLMPVPACYYVLMVLWQDNNWTVWYKGYASAADEVANASHLSPLSNAEEAVEKTEPKKPNETAEEAAAAQNEAEEAISEHYCNFCENTFKTHWVLSPARWECTKPQDLLSPRLMVLLIATLMMKLSATFAKNATKKPRLVRISPSCYEQSWDWWCIPGIWTWLGWKSRISFPWHVSSLMEEVSLHTMTPECLSLLSVRIQPFLY